MRNALVAAVALACGACTVADGRARVEVEPATLRAADRLDVTVRARGAERAELLVDGVVVEGSARVGVTLSLDVSTLAEGPHRFTARLEGTPYPVERTVDLVVDRQGPAISFDPPSGRIVSIEPLTVTVRIDDPSGVSTSAVSLSPPSAGSVTRIDVRTWRVTAAEPLERTGQLSMTVAAEDGLGNRTALGGGFSAPVLAGSIDRAEDPLTGAPRVLAGTAVTRGTVRASFTGDVPSAVELLAGGVKVGEGAVTAGRWEVSWDTTRVPDGARVLELRVPGWWPHVAGPSVTIDNTPPVVLGCGVAPQWEGAVSVRAAIRPILSEPYDYTPALYPELRVDGVAQPWMGLGDGTLVLSSRPAVPATLEVVFPAGSVRDVAGNVAAPHTCALPLTSWVRPFGAGPIADAGAPISAARAACAASRWDDGSSARALAWIGAPGSPAAGELRSGAGNLGAVAGATATELLVGEPGWMAWIERSAGGPGRIYLRESWWSPSGSLDGPLNSDPANDARDLAAYGEFASPTLAWSEATAEGGRAIHVLHGVTARVSDPARTAGAPAVTGSSVAFLEGASPEPAILRVTDFSGVDVGVPPLNRDPATAAAEPTLVASWGVVGVAWTEAGDVLLRTREPTEPQGWSAPQVMNADPLRPARSPHLVGGYLASETWLVFVQDTPAGAEIRARRWNGAAWTLVEAPVNEGGGGVASLAVDGALPDAALTITWTDDAGRVHVRAYNE